MKLDIGCGTRKTGPDWTGVDKMSFPGVDVVLDVAARDSNYAPHESGVGGVTAPGPLRFKRWPWDDNSVDEINCSHFLEHLEADERVHFANEVFRILKPGCKATITVPWWASQRAYGDLTHKWPPVVFFWTYYLLKSWRAVNAPHNTDYTCDFDAAGGTVPMQDGRYNGRNDEYIQEGMRKDVDGASDLIITLTKPVTPR